MIRITQLKLSVNHTEVQLHKKIARTLKCPEGSFSYEIIRQSLDARHKEDKKFVYTVDVVVPNEKQILKKACEAKFHTFFYFSKKLLTSNRRVTIIRSNRMVTLFGGRTKWKQKKKFYTRR